MALKSDATRWGSLAKFFHWTIVLLILAQAIIGLVMVELPKRPSSIPVYSFHKSLGITILALAVLRLGWRLFDPRPREVAGMPHWQALGARLGHVLLYVLIFAVPLSGWLFDSASSLRPLYWFNLFPLPNLTGGKNEAVKEFAEGAHELLFWVLVVVAAGHAAAALIHHFHNRDETLVRMLPWRNRAGRAPSSEVS
ncbi:cytochrome b [Dokdonella sp.]|uniref:cytochrome b n=1 Tax=Dokdonella sp. TaxID=2291710 RepID=UPI001B1633F1|nr:cytochrome b [Dokdonella sp.]MBO9664694.1 cytochrome b [Dokdonella sp.]